jgi:hypothetical protein
MNTTKKRKNHEYLLLDHLHLIQIPLQLLLLRTFRSLVFLLKLHPRGPGELVVEDAAPNHGDFAVGSEKGEEVIE